MFCQKISKNIVKIYMSLSSRYCDEVVTLGRDSKPNLIAFDRIELKFGKEVNKKFSKSIEKHQQISKKIGEIDYAIIITFFRR